MASRHRESAHVWFAGLIGAFMGAVGLHADLSGMPSFRQVMQRVRKVPSLPKQASPNKINIITLSLECLTKFFETCEGQ